MSAAQTLWTAYKALLEGGKYNAWENLWASDGEFVVVYGDDSVDGQERYSGVSEIVSFISGRKENILKTQFLNDEVYPIENRSGDFFCCFDIRITMTDGEEYENRIVCRFETRDSKITRIVEYGHPVRRRRFVDHLAQLHGSVAGATHEGPYT